MNGSIVHCTMCTLAHSLEPERERANERMNEWMNCCRIASRLPSTFSTPLSPSSKFCLYFLPLLHRRASPPPSVPLILNRGPHPFPSRTAGPARLDWMLNVTPACGSGGEGVGVGGEEAGWTEARQSFKTKRFSLARPFLSIQTLTPLSHPRAAHAPGAALRAAPRIVLRAAPRTAPRAAPRLHFTSQRTPRRSASTKHQLLSVGCLCAAWAHQPGSQAGSTRRRVPGDQEKVGSLGQRFSN